jgi:excisionase family DNA binding protein
MPINAHGRAYSAGPNPSPDDEIQLYRVADALRILGIGRTSFYQLVQNGDLKTVRIRGRVLVPRKIIQQFVGSLSA